MSVAEMTGWKEAEKYVVGRMDRFDDRLDRIDIKLSEQGKQIDAFRVEILKLVTDNRIDIGLFKKEFKIKTSAWAFLGTAIALALFVIGYLIKNQLI